MKRAILAGAALLLVAACGGPASPRPSPSPTVQALIPITTFFLKEGMVAPVRRQATLPGARLSTALDALLAGPSAAEQQAGYSSSVPAGTAHRGLYASVGSVHVDLSNQFAAGGGSVSVASRLAQVVYTVTQLDPGAEVTFALDGVTPAVFTSDGLVIDHAVTRVSYESLTPAVLVLSPLPGDKVADPVHVEGTANVYEAQFSIELAAGTQKTTVAVTASAGTGTRGRFSATLEAGGYRGPATLVAWDSSAKDGSRQDLQTVAVTVTG